MEEVKAQTLLWKAPGFPYPVTFPSTLLDQIRSEAVEGFYAVPRGGIELGGVLFGVIRDRKLEIQARRQIKCEYKTGPSFVLSPKDKDTLRAVLLLPFSDPELSGLSALGWYHSHTRSEISLSDLDVDLHREFFPDCWQIALILRPFHLKPTRAGFFFPDSSGRMQGDPSSQDLILEPPAYGLTLLDQDGLAVPNEIAAPVPMPAEEAGTDAVRENGAGSGADAGTVQQNLRLLNRLVTSAPSGTQENGTGSKPEAGTPDSQPAAHPSESIRLRPIRYRRMRLNKSSRRIRPARRLNTSADSVRPVPPPAAPQEKMTESARRLPLPQFNAEGITRIPVPVPAADRGPAKPPLETPSKEKQPPRFTWSAFFGRLWHFLYRSPQFSSDRRTAHRESGDCLLAYYWEGATSRPRKIRNISRRGAFIETDFHWPSGTRIVLTLEIAKKQKSTDSAPDGIAVDAVVSRLTEDGMGLQFILPDAGRQTQWAMFLARWKPLVFPVPPVSKSRR